MADVVSFMYESLDMFSDEIRLLTLQPADVSAEIRVSIATVRRSDSGLKYEALSYMWGDCTVTRPILLNGQEKHVGLNLWHTLQQLRHQRKIRVLWIDALCIDQSNNNEKNDQVRQTDEIYKQADQVLVWIGPDNLQAAENLVALMAELSAPIMRPEPEILDFVLRFANLDYWTRIWIVQEVSLSSRCKKLAYWGSKPFTWISVEELFEFCKFSIGTHTVDTSLVSSKQIISRKTALFESTTAQFFSGWQGGKPPDEDENETPLTDCEKKYFEKQDSPALLDLILRFDKSRCTDLRDMAFGLHGLAAECCRKNLAIDYSKSALRVCWDILVHTKSHHHHSDFKRFSKLYTALEIRKERISNPRVRQGNSLIAQMPDRLL